MTARHATTAVGVLAAISFSHLLNDTVQSLVPAIYPLLKSTFALTFAQIGLLTLTLQLLQVAMRCVIFIDRFIIVCIDHTAITDLFQQSIRAEINIKSVVSIRDASVPKPLFFGSPCFIPSPFITAKAVEFIMRTCNRKIPGILLKL